MKRLFVLLVILSLLNSYIGLRMLARWPLAAAHPGLFWLCMAGFVLLQLAGPFSDEIDFYMRLQHSRVLQAVYRAFNWLCYSAIGIFSCLFMFTLAADILSLLWQLILPPSDEAAFDYRVFLGIAALTAATLGFGILQTRMGPAIHRVDIVLENLPAAFEGFTIAQVSDLHVGPTIGRRFTQKVVDLTNGLKADLIALTGDFIDGPVAQLKEDIAPLSGLKAPSGVYYIPGNHEYYWGFAEWMEEFKTLGADVLLNEHRVLRRGGDALILAGVTDYSTLHMSEAHRMDPVKALAGAPEGLVKILLAHQPASYRLAHPAGFDLQLSGHTHGGQYFPFSLIIRFFQTYYKGLNRHEDMWIYVNTGTGYWGPPLRAGVPPEITVLRLTAGKKA